MNAINKTVSMLNMIAQRQEVLANNLANVDTPNYTRKDIDFSQCLDNSVGTKLSQKMGYANNIEDSGERVNAADELAEMQKNYVMYTVAAKRISKIITELKTVSNVGK